MKSFIFGKVFIPIQKILVNEIAEEVIRSKPDFLIGIGGGSVLDVTKAVSIVASNEGYAWDYVNYPEGPNAMPYLNIPVICIPTTAGTGSEVNRYAVISNPKRKEKLVISHSLLYPKISFVDPSLLRSLSPKLTALTAMDAFFHALESFTNKLENPLAEMYAIEAIKLIWKWLPVAYEEPENLKARSFLAFASTLGGYAIDMKRVALIHGMEHPISAHYPKITHPEGLCALSLYVTKFNMEGTKEKYEVITDLLGYGRSFYKILDILSYLLDRFDLPKNIRDLGVERNKIERLAEDTFILSRRLLNINPKEPTLDDIISMYEKAYEGEI